MKQIYLDNAATTPLAKEVAEAMIPVLTDVFGNPSSSHATGRKAKALIETSRRDIAKRLGCEPKNIIFTSGGTEADNMAIRCGILDNNIKHAITSSISHKAVIYPLEELKEKLKEQ